MEEVTLCKCGNKATPFCTSYNFWFYCQNRFRHSESKNNPQDAITAWNRRVTQNIGKEGAE